MNPLRSPEALGESAASNIINLQDLSSSGGKGICSHGLSLPVGEVSIVNLTGLDITGKTTNIKPLSNNIRKDHRMSRLKIYATLTVAFMSIAIGGWWILYNAFKFSTEDFEIYLSDTNEVILSAEDIVSYNKTSHEIKLTGEGAKKIEKLSYKVPMNGTKFMIRVNGEDTYGGWFWSPISSISCSGVVIETLFTDDMLRIETGYPSNHFQGEDPRNNPEVFNYFEAWGKLVD